MANDPSTGGSGGPGAVATVTVAVVESAVPLTFDTRTQ